jgi:hypothetical protein
LSKANNEVRAMNIKLISTGVLAMSLALAANAAPAAVAQSHKSVTVARVGGAQPSHVASYDGRGGAQASPSYSGTGWGVGPTHTARVSGYGGWQGARYAANGYAPRSQLGFDVSQFIQSMLGGGPVPYANLARDVERMHGSSYAGSPTYDTSAPVSAGNDAQAAADAENQAIQQMNDTNALIASMAAAEAQNDAAVAAAQQTEINAGM